MKNSTPLKFTHIIAVIFLANLFISCDLDKSKLTQDATNVEEEIPTSVELGDVDIAFCDTKVENHHGCHCNFKGNDKSGSSIFLSNMNQSKSACISINGKTEIVTGKRMDERQDHLKHSHIPDWIVLDPDGDVHIFNELVDDTKYEENKDLIVQTMLVMHDLPKEMKIRKNKEGKGEEVSADLAGKYEKMWSESLSYASEQRAKGNHGAPLEIELSNEKFNVYVKGNVEKHNADGSDNYKGTIEVKSKSGDLLGSRDFSGLCICEE